MKYRIAIWSALGFLIAASWGVYFANADRAKPIAPIVDLLARLTQPAIAAIVSISNYPLGLRAAVAANVVTYAVVGFVIESVRKRHTN